jgi:hypothetical protein
MEKSFITISGQEYRVEVNWEAVVNFLKEEGRDTLDALISFSSLKPSEIPALMAAAINEGEQLEGRECHFTAKTLAPILRSAHVTRFMEIYISQTRLDIEEEPEPKKKGF